MASSTAQQRWVSLSDAVRDLQSRGGYAGARAGEIVVAAALSPLVPKRGALGSSWIRDITHLIHAAATVVVITNEIANPPKRMSFRGQAPDNDALANGYEFALVELEREALDVYASKFFDFPSREVAPPRDEASGPGTRKAPGPKPRAPDMRNKLEELIDGGATFQSAKAAHAAVIEALGSPTGRGWSYQTFCDACRDLLR